MTDVLRVNHFFKLANRADVDSILSRIILSERQIRIFDMFYLKRQNVNFIADSLFVSPAVINRELKTIREKISIII